MRNILSRLTDWLYGSRVSSVIHTIFVATYPVSVAEVVEQHPEVGASAYECGVCTAVRTMVITAAVTSLIWWIA